MTVPVDINYEEEAFERLLYQFRNKPNVKALLGSLIKPLEDLQDEMFTLLNGRSLSTATGSFLDDIGSIVGRSRDAAPDDAYRDALRLHILINNSEGTPKQVLSIIKTYTESSAVEMFEHYPANVHMSVDSISNIDAAYKTLLAILPVCCTNAVIIHNDDSFIGSELLADSFQLERMVDSEGNNIQDNLENDIVVTSYLGSYAGQAILEELPTYGGGEGKAFAEIYDKNR